MEDQTHDITDTLAEIRCLDNDPPWSVSVLLGFQHALVASLNSWVVASTLVSRIGGSTEHRISLYLALLFSNAIMTFVQSLVGSRLPIVMTGSLSYMIVADRIARRYSFILDEDERFHRSIASIRCALFGAAVVQSALGFSGLWALLLRYIGPISIGTVSSLTALGFAYGVTGGYPTGYGFPGVASCVEIGLTSLLLLVVFALLLSTRLTRNYRYPVVVTSVIVWLLALILTGAGAYSHASPLAKAHCRTDVNHFIKHAPWATIPGMYRKYSFDFPDVLSYALTAVGDQLLFVVLTYTVSRLAGAQPPPPYVVSRAATWQGVGNLVNAIVGASTGSTISVENAGVLGLTQIGSTKAVQCAAGFMLVFSIFGKLGALFASIPLPIFAGITLILYCVVAGTGVSYLQYVNLSLMRNLYLIGATFVLGLSLPSTVASSIHNTRGNYGLVHTNSSWFNAVTNSILCSPGMVGAILVIILDSALKASRKDRGCGWWKRFHKWSSSPEVEYYKLPTTWLNKYFPPPNM